MKNYAINLLQTEMNFMTMSLHGKLKEQKKQPQGFDWQGVQDLQVQIASLKEAIEKLAIN